MMKITGNTNKNSFAIGDEIIIELDFNNSPELLDDLTNININIYRFDIERNNFVLGFGHPPQVEEGKVLVKRTITESFNEGVHFINGVKLIYGEEVSKQLFFAPGRDVPEMIFWVSDSEKNIISSEELSLKIKELSIERNKFTNKEIITEKAHIKPDSCNLYKVFIFSVGCLVHNPQIMAGYTIYPLKGGYDYTHMHQSVNEFLKSGYGISIPYEKSIAENFGRSTPLFVVVFHNVRAVEYSDAAVHCSRFAENLFTILSFEKGQRPNQYATVTISPHESRFWQSFHFPGYSGNLVSDFNPASTAGYIENLLPLIEKSPWIDLLIKTFSEAQSEKNIDFAYLKLWSILEMISKKRVPEKTIPITYPDGSAITYGDGTQVKTDSALGKTYHWLFQNNFQQVSVNFGPEGIEILFEGATDISDDPNFRKNKEVICLWDVVSGLYEIRNSTAHSGEFNPISAKSGNGRQRIAAKLYELPYNHLLSHIQGIVKLLISNEISNEKTS